MRGKVIRWERGKNYGFIRSFRNKKIFVRRRDIRGRKRPREGQKVKFTLVHDEKGRPKAVNVSVKYHTHFSKVSKLSEIFILSLILFLITWLLIKPKYENSFIDIVVLVSLFSAELSGLFIFLLKLDRISIRSTLRLWGLRLLSLVIMMVGLWIIYMSFIIDLFFSPFLEISSLSTFFSGTLPFLILGLGLSLIGGYLEFKFMINSGVVIHRGLGW